MSFALSAACSDDGRSLMLSVESPLLLQPADVHICIVLDVSGSMSDLCDDSATATAGKEQSYLTRLDIAKHAVKTVIACLNETSCFSLVTYSTHAATLLNALPMTDHNKAEAHCIVDRIAAGGSTNMWEGMEAGLEILSASSKSMANQHLMVLTDGDRPDVPPRGFVGSMQRLKEQWEQRYPCLVHTFGFGYQLDSKLLYQIAAEGNGLFAFIPDGSMVGTVFINAFANAVTLTATDLRLAVALPGGVTGCQRVMGSCSQVDHRAWGVEIRRPVMFEARRWDVLLTLNVPVSSFLKDAQHRVIHLSLRSSDGRSVHVTDADATAFTLQPWDENRATLVRMHAQLVAGLSSQEVPVDALCGELRAAASSVDNETRHVLEQWRADVDGEVRMALSSRDRFSRWGRHYLPSLARAHDLEMGHNFKDPGVQVYTSPTFERMRDLGEDLFVRLPSPVSTYRYKPYTPVGNGSGSSNNGNGTNNTNTVDMSTYVDRAGGCFHPSCVVSLQGCAQPVPIDRLKKGDVLAPHGAVVECIVKSARDPHTQWLRCETTGLVITPWHPVWVPAKGEPDWQWQFPCDLHSTLPWHDAREEDAYGVMYNVVLVAAAADANADASVPYIVVNGVRCATLGHGIADDPVVSHPFLGTDRVREALQMCRGYWDEGVVEVSFLREGGPSGLLNGLLDVHKQFAD